MANHGIQLYRLSAGVLSRGLTEGFDMGADGVLSSGGDGSYRSLLLPGLDSAQEDCAWGRLSFRARLEGDVVLSVRAFASNTDSILQDGVSIPIDRLLLDPAVSQQQKVRLFKDGGGIHALGAADLLLYGQTGRYLWLWVEVNGVGHAQLSDVRVLVPGDNFYRTFPALYQTDGDFFHRYLSIFSALYTDLQKQVDRLHEYLDLETCPGEVLPVFARWLGLEMDGNFLDEDHLRQLLGKMPQILAAKGTRRAVELVAKLFVTGPIYLVERNLLDRNQLSGGSELYGDSPYDFTLLLSQPADELLRARLGFLIDQFKPLRSRCHIVFLGDQGGLDAFSYLDLNAALLQVGSGHLDEGGAQAGMIHLE